MTTPFITVASRWRGKQTPIEVTITRVTAREVSYITLDRSLAGTLQQWLFLQNFQPVPERKKRGH